MESFELKNPASELVASSQETAEAEALMDRQDIKTPLSEHGVDLMDQNDRKMFLEIFVGYKQGKLDNEGVLSTFLGIGANDSYFSNKAKNIYNIIINRLDTPPATTLAMPVPTDVADTLKDINGGYIDEDGELKKAA